MNNKDSSPIRESPRSEKDLTVAERWMIVGYRRFQGWLTGLKTLLVGLRDFIHSLALHVAVLAILFAIVAFKRLDGTKGGSSGNGEFATGTFSSESRTASSLRIKVPPLIPSRLPVTRTSLPIATMHASSVLDLPLPPLPSPEIKLGDLGDALAQKISVNGLGGITGPGIDQLGIGSGKSGLGTGIGNINFFGIFDSGKRVAFLVDVSSSMIDPQKGGYEGYQRVKTELARLVNELSEETRFNVILFGPSVLCLERDHLLLATAESKKAAAEFIQPVYDETGPGNPETRNLAEDSSHLYSPKITGIPLIGGTRIDLAMLAALEQGVDAIFIISDGVPQVYGWTTVEVMNKIQRWRSEICSKQNRPQPRVHVVSYEADASGRSFLQSLAGRNQGQFIRIKGFTRTALPQTPLIQENASRKANP